LASRAATVEDSEAIHGFTGSGLERVAEQLKPGAHAEHHGTPFARGMQRGRNC